jgi:hypothetical protein
MSIMMSVDIGTAPKSNMGRKAKNPDAPKRGSGLYKANSSLFRADPALFWINAPGIISEVQKQLLEMAYGPKFYAAQTRALVSALRPVHAQAKAKIPRPGTPRMFKHKWATGAETKIGEYGLTGNLAEAFIITANKAKEYPGAKIGVDSKFGSKVRRGRDIVNSRPAFYAHLVELGFIAKSRVPGIVGRRKIKRADRGKRTTPNDLIRYLRQKNRAVKSAQTKVGKVAAAQYESEALRSAAQAKAQAKLATAQTQLDKSLYGQTERGTGARIKLSQAKLKRRNLFISKMTRQKKTRVPGKFFLRDAWDQNAEKVAAIYLARVVAEYQALLPGLKPPPRKAFLGIF